MHDLFYPICVVVILGSFHWDTPDQGCHSYLGNTFNKVSLNVLTLYHSVDSSLKTDDFCTILHIVIVQGRTEFHRLS